MHDPVFAAEDNVFSPEGLERTRTRVSFYDDGLEESRGRGY